MDASVSKATCIWKVLFVAVFLCSVIRHRAPVLGLSGVQIVWLQMTIDCTQPPPQLRPAPAGLTPKEGEEPGLIPAGPARCFVLRRPPKAPPGWGSLGQGDSFTPAGCSSRVFSPPRNCRWVHTACGRQTVPVLVSELPDRAQSVVFSSGRCIPRAGRAGPSGPGRERSG